MAEISSNLTDADRALRDAALYTAGDAVTLAFAKLESVLGAAAAAHAFTRSGELLVIDLGGGEQLIASGVSAAPGAQGVLSAASLARVSAGDVLETFAGELSLACHETGGKLALDGLTGRIDWLQLDHLPGPAGHVPGAGASSLRLDGAIDLRDGGAAVLRLTGLQQEAALGLTSADYSFLLELDSTVRQLASGATASAQLTPIGSAIHFANGQREIIAGLAEGAIAANAHPGDAVLTTPALLAGDDTVLIQQTASRTPLTVQTGDGMDTISVSVNAEVTIEAGGGDDLIGLVHGTVDGGDGIDTVRIGAHRYEARTAVRADGAIVVSVGTATEAMAVAVLTNVERIRYPEISIAFDIGGNAGTLYRLYDAAFGRAADSDGFGYWLSALDSGKFDAGGIADAFLGSSEFSAHYGTLASDTAFIEVLYRNVLRREADAGGTDYWSGVLAQGASRAEVLAGLSESPEHQAMLIGQIQNGISYAHYVSA